MGAADNERQTRRRQYQNALEYYKSKHQESIPYDPTLEIPDDNTIINLIQLTADRTVSFLFPHFPTIYVDNKQDEWLQDCLDHNGGLFFLVKLGLRGFLSGHNFVAVREDKPYPALSLLEPGDVAIYWDDMQSVLWYEQHFKIDEIEYIRDYVKQSNQTWVIYTYARQKDKYEVLETTLHTFDVPPIIEWPHLPDPAGYYGLHEFLSKDMQDTINRMASDRNRINRENADPIDVVIGADIKDVEPGDNFMSIAQPGAKIQRLETRGDMAGMNDTIEHMIKLYLNIARVVIISGEAKDLQRVNNAAIRILFSPMSAKNNILRDSYLRGLRKVFRLMRAIAFRNGDVDRIGTRIRIDLGDPLPSDLTEIANVNAIQAQLGARSKKTAAEAIGDNWDVEKENMKNESSSDPDSGSGIFQRLGRGGGIDRNSTED